MDRHKNVLRSINGFLDLSCENWFLVTLSSITEKRNLMLGNSTGFASQKSLKIGMKIDRKPLNMGLPLKCWTARPGLLKIRDTPPGGA